MIEIEYHRHSDGSVVRGPAIRCIDPDAGAHDVYVLTPDELANDPRYRPGETS